MAVDDLGTTLYIDHLYIDPIFAKVEAQGVGALAKELGVEDKHIIIVPETSERHRATRKSYPSGRWR